jgi:7-keto-8-aminopelargonate synthetase-like enzyme
MLTELHQELEQIIAAGRERHFHEALPRRDGCVSLRGRTLIDFTSWDLYDLNHHPAARRVVQRTIEEHGLTAGAARGSSGSSGLHSMCERRLAEFTGFEAATVFSSKNQAILSLLTAIASERDVVVFDEAMQSPVGDAAYLVNCPSATFPAAQLTRARAELEKAKGARRRFVCVESVSPITGEALDLAAWSAVAVKCDAELIVDESYAIGTVGLRGSGGLESVPLRTGVLCAFADCALTLAAGGAFIAGPLTLVRYLMQRSRTFVAEVAPPPFLMAALEGAVGYVELGHNLRERIGLTAGKLRAGLLQMGALGREQGNSPIICVPMKSLRVAKEIAEALFQKGVLVEVLARPSSGSAPYSDGLAFLRLLVSALHTQPHVEATLQACSEIWTKAEVK